MRTKRVVSFFLSVAVAAMTVSGTWVSASAEEKTKLTVMLNGAAQNPPERKAYYESLAEAFEAEYPDVEVELQSAADGGFGTKLNTAFASGTAPDVLYTNLAILGQRVPLGQFYPLTEYTENWDQLDDFMENPLQLGQVGGVQYGIPIFADARLLLYNKALFEEAGLDPNTPPTNWEELKAAHEALTKKDENGNVTQVGFSIPTSGSGLHHLLSIFIEQNGVKNLVDEDTNEILFHTTEAVEAAEFLGELREIGNIPWDSTELKNDPFVKGDAAMTITTTAIYNVLKQSELEADIAVGNPLSNKEAATFCGMHFLAITADSANKDVAWKFIAFAQSAERMWDRYEQIEYAPLRESLRERYISEDPATHEVMYNSIAHGHGSPKVLYGNSLADVVNTAMEEISYGVRGVQEALDAAAEQLKEEIG